MCLDAEIEPVKVSVNFSKHHIKTKEAALNIIGILNRYAIDPKYIEVELTESACYEDMAKIKEFLEEQDYNAIFFLFWQDIFAVLLEAFLSLCARKAAAASL